jgi:hypothetical protein
MINLGIIVGDQIGAIDTACISSTIALALLILLLKKKKKVWHSMYLVGKLASD